MSRRALLCGFLLAVCLATLRGVWGQRSQLAALRAEQQQLMAELAAKADAAPFQPAVEPGTLGAATSATDLEVTSELLRLRSVVTRLTERRRELAGVREENEGLRAQLASRGTNGPGGFQWPPGYVRKSEARMVGYNTPEDTLQSFLWAVRSRDVTNALQAFVPEKARELRGELGGSGQSIELVLYNAASFFGMRIVKREQNPRDGSILAWVEVVPGVPGPAMCFRQVEGQWKIVWGP